MKLRRLDDYQSWAVEQGGKRLLIDPWLTEEMCLPPGHWLFGRRRAAPVAVTTWLPVHAVVLTAHFSDHLDPTTLAQLPKDVPVFATRTAAALVRRLGFSNVTALRDGERASVWSGLDVEAIAPGFPYAHNSLGYVFSGDDKRVYLETHMVNVERAAERVGAVDVMVAPVQSVRLLGIPFVMSPEKAAAVANVLKPKRWVPTGDEPGRSHGLLHSLLLSYRGAVADFQQRLRETTLRVAAPGDVFDV